MMINNKTDMPWRGNTVKNIVDRFSVFQDKKNNFKRDNTNVKKILCNNMTTNGECKYGDKCHFAHNLSEQTIEGNRVESYGILLSKKQLDNYDMQKNYGLYKSLLDLTKLCEQCEKGKCTGGYNCKFGACAKKYQICARDLNYGDCFYECGNVHLTKRGLKPFYGTKIKCSTPNGTLLSPEFFKKLDQKKLSDNDSDSTISMESNNSQIDDCDKSIFDKN